MLSEVYSKGGSFNTESTEKILHDLHVLGDLYVMLSEAYSKGGSFDTENIENMKNTEKNNSSWSTCSR